MSGIAQHGTHQALVYETRDELLEQLIPFVAGGRSVGDPVLSVTSSANNEALREALGEVSGEVDFRDAADWYQHPYRTLEAYREYVHSHANGHTVRVIGEPLWDGRSPADIREWERYEAVLNVAFATSPAWIVCPYDAGSLPDEIVERAAHTHPEIIRGGAVSTSECFEEPADFVEAFRTGEQRPAPPDAAAITLAGADYAAVRRFISHAAAQAALPADRVEELLLAVNELTSNAAAYGRPPVVVRTWREGHELVCEVADSGGGFADRLAGYTLPAASEPQGRGLWIVRQLCRCVEVLRGDAGFAVRIRVACGG